MNPPDETAPPGGPIDALDVALLGSIADLYSVADPMPPGLIERCQFALALEEIDAEVSRLREEAALVSAARGDEETRTITFDSTSLTIMITISLGSGDTVRLDGWLSPPAPHRVEMRTAGGRLHADADAQGRFVLDGVPRGLAQIVVRTVGSGPEGNGRSVVTPSIVV